MRYQWTLMEGSGLAAALDVPPGLTPGTPFRTMSEGECVSPFSGERFDVDRPISREDLEEMARVFGATREQTPVIIDWGHESAGSLFGGSTPESSGALGQIVAMQVVEDERGAGLVVTPAYTERGLRVVEEHEGALWSSPEFTLRPMYDRTELGREVGSAQILAIALTSRPAQAATTLDPVIRSMAAMSQERACSEKKERAMPETLEEALELIKALTEENEALKAAAEALKADGEAEERAAEDEDKAESEPTTPSEPEGGASEPEKEEEMKRALRGQVASQERIIRSLQAEVSQMKAEKAAAEEKAEVDGRIQRGLIAPGEADAARMAWRLRSKAPAMWALFSSRETPVVPLEEIGHGAHGPDAKGLTEEDLLDHKIQTEMRAMRDRGEEPDYVQVLRTITSPQEERHG